MSNTSDSNTKSHTFGENGDELTASREESAPFERSGEAPLSVEPDDAPVFSKEKPEAPASEVVEFQDAASSMKNMSPENVPDEAMFIEEEPAGEEEKGFVEARESPQGSGGRSKYHNGKRGSTRDLLIEHILEKAHRAHPTLRDQLRGTILISVNDGRERYMVDWRNDPIIVNDTKEADAECTISIQERDLELIAQGNLNPQIAMLSEKIRIRGNSSFAMYFFNLVAPAS